MTAAGMIDSSVDPRGQGDGDGESDDATPVDGRRARRERSRAAVIDAVFTLVQAGHVPPTPDDVAREAGVSVSSVFRNFDGLADIQHQAYVLFQQRYAHLFAVTVERDAPRDARVEAHVNTRTTLFASAGAVMTLARQRALDYPPMAERVERSRAQLAAQTRRHFAAEVDRLDAVGGRDLVGVIDGLTSPETYSVMTGAHAMTSAEVATAWTTAVASLLAGWPGLDDTTQPQLTEDHR